MKKRILSAAVALCLSATAVLPATALAANTAADAPASYSAATLAALAPDNDTRDIPIAGMKATAGSEQSTVGGEGPAKNVLDNNTGTIWHTKWAGSPYSQNWITIDLGGKYMVDGLRLLPRQSATNGMIKKYQIMISSDGKDFYPISEGTWAVDSDWKDSNFMAVPATHVKVQTIECVTDGATFSSAAEIRVRGEAYTEGMLDKGKLFSLVQANNYNEMQDYAFGNWRDFTTAMMAAKEIINSETATQPEIDAALVTLQTAVDALVYIKGINTLINANKNNLQEDYTADAWAAFKIAYDAAVIAVANENLTHEEATKAETDLQTAVNGLVKIVPLQTAVAANANKALHPEFFTKDTFDIFLSAYQAAEATLENSAATQAEVDAALATLNAGAKQLVDVESIVAAKAKLSAYASTLTSLVQSDYTTGSWAAFATQLANANALLATTDTAAAYTAAWSSLYGSVLNLAKSSYLNYYIVAYAGVMPTTYTAGSYSVFKIAFDAAKAAQTKEEVSSAYVALIEAGKQLVKISDLQYYVDVYTYKVQSNYTAQSWATFKAAFDKAETILKKANATTAEVTEAYVAIVNDGKNLVWR